MGTFIKTLMDKAKANIIYPRTVASAVVRSDGTTTVETALANKPDKPSLLTGVTSWADTDLIMVEDGTGVKKMSVAYLKSLLGVHVSGTFTPTLDLQGGALTVAYAVRNATYTKIGNRVFIEVHILTSTWTHALTINFLVVGSLPFAPSTSPTQKVMFAGGLFPYVKTGSLGLKPIILTNVYGGNIMFVAEFANGGSDLVTASYLPSGAQFEIHISGSYITNA